MCFRIEALRKQVAVGNQSKSDGRRVQVVKEGVRLEIGSKERVMGMWNLAPRKRQACFLDFYYRDGKFLQLHLCLVHCVTVTITISHSHRHTVT